MKDVRKQVAELATDLYVGKIGYEQFVNAVPAEAWDDEEVTDLIDLITHEPKVGGFLGVDETQGKQSRGEITALIDNLR